MTFDLVIALVAAVWNEGVSLAPQAVSRFRVFYKAVNL